MNATFGSGHPSLPGLKIDKFIGEEEPSLLDEIGRFRVDVWRTDDRVISEIDGLDAWIGPYDSKGIHWVIREDNHIVASARLSVHTHTGDFPDCDDWSYLCPLIKPPFSSMNRLVVAPRLRRKGIAKFLDGIRIEASIDLHVASIIVQIREERIRSLQRQSFVLQDSRSYLPSHNTWHYMIRYLEPPHEPGAG